jgi:hypothetical protein
LLSEGRGHLFCWYKNPNSQTFFQILLSNLGSNKPQFPLSDFFMVLSAKTYLSTGTNCRESCTLSSANVRWITGKRQTFERII